MSTAIARSEIAAALALAIAREAANADAELIAEAARLHEVGKLYVPAELLFARPADLDQPQREQLAGNAVHGHALARGAGVPDRACAWILNARERWDGGGPTGLAGEDIPFGSRVIAVSREYLDAPLSAPPDAGERDPREVARDRLRALGGSLLDPELAEIGTELAAPAPDIVVRATTDADHDRIATRLAERNAAHTARNGELVDPLQHPMLLAEEHGEMVGLLTWIDDGEEVEILDMHATERYRGIGTALVEELATRCAGLGRRAVVATTTNDNVDALRFYQRRGFRLRALRPGAIEEARARLKPSIPTEGYHGIYKRDELELERIL
jgi:ribosomal protein S18 acetylase RimI-like enzyme